MNTPVTLSTPNAVRHNAAKSVNETVQQNEVRTVVMVGRGAQPAANESAAYRLYEAENAAEAQQGILQLLNSYRLVPSVVVIRHSQLVAEDCKKWEAFFASHPILCTIPIFVLADEVSDELKASVKKYRFIDEIITPACMQKKLFAKVDFVKKVKRMQSIPGTVSTPPRAKHKKNYLDTFLKRTLDIVAASTGLVLASPIMLVIAALIRLESRGPIFYSSLRAGRNYRVFKFYKFRTMVPDADKQLDKLKHMNQYDTNGNGPTFIKVSNDPRITRLGNFLRNSSLDELPQLVNVLRGDMSLVGNRPLPLYEATTLTTDEWVERFLAPAGITGLWQISKRGKKEMSVEERINLDIDYADKHSFTYDMWLIVNTPFALIQKDNV